MINKIDICKYFDAEAQAAQKSWEALMSLSVKERIRKRKAIENVYLDDSYVQDDDPEEDMDIFRVTFDNNLSDFKEGETLILHNGLPDSGVKCRLYSFIDDHSLLIEVFPPNLPDFWFDNILNKPLLLDKDCVDLRNNVYHPFLADLTWQEEFWRKLVFNKFPRPTFEDKEKCKQELEETCESFELKLLRNQKTAIINCMAAKDYYLIQGPPGSGKSFVLAIIIAEELLFFKHNVIVIGPNHMAINNTLEQLIKFHPLISSCTFKVGPVYQAPTFSVLYEDNEFKITNLRKIDGLIATTCGKQWIIGLTPHSLYTSKARNLYCDTLIIDEAGQMTIPLALMGMIKAKKVIFAGDHKQLPPIITSDEIHEELKLSAFKSILRPYNSTMLNVSFRMCEPICMFVSDLFYDGKLKPKKKGCGNMIVCNDPLYDFRFPIIVHNVEDDGEQTSDKEAEYIAATIAGFINKGLTANEVAVLSPFRAQAANVRRHIRKQSEITEEQRKQIAADTIDKMQGQEREVIIYSLVSGDMDYITEMAEFLYNPNKMNVAFSRAKSKLIIVGNIEQIKKINSVEYPHIKKMIESNLVKFV